MQTWFRAAVLSAVGLAAPTQAGAETLFLTCTPKLDPAKQSYAFETRPETYQVRDGQFLFWNPTYNRFADSCGSLGDECELTVDRSNIIYRRIYKTAKLRQVININRISGRFLRFGYSLRPEDARDPLVTSISGDCVRVANPEHQTPKF